MGSLPLRYGANPHQMPARVCRAGGLPLAVLNGQPGYINLLDALNSWQLVRELRNATNLASAASFKHVSPAGAAVAAPLSPAQRQAYFVDDLELSPLATAYARARGADRLSSFGDWVALSDRVDAATARLLRREVSDGVIAPAYDDDALAMLRHKRGGSYVVIQMDPAYVPDPVEQRQVFGVTFEQRRNDAVITQQVLQDIVTTNRKVPPSAARDMLVALIALKYTQSNSVGLVVDGQIIGMGAGQQSRVHCTRLAADKADTWWLRQHPATLGLSFRPGLGRPERDNAIDAYLREDLTPMEEQLSSTAFAQPPRRLTREEKRAWLDAPRDVVMGSDAFFPFRDSIDRAARSGVRYVVQPGGSVRDDDVAAACDSYGMVMVRTGLRLFHH